MSENRDCFSFHPCVDLNADWAPWHVLFKAGSFTEGLLPEGLKYATNGMMSYTKGGMQTGSSLLSWY